MICTQNFDVISNYEHVINTMLVMFRIRLCCQIFSEVRVTYAGFI
jgi:hypothetical protein